MQPERLDFLTRWVATHPHRIHVARGLVYENDERNRLVARLNWKGYLRALLTVDGIDRQYSVHEIIAVAAGMDLRGAVRVIHTNRIMTDNRPSNLAVVPCSD